MRTTGCVLAMVLACCFCAAAQTAAKSPAKPWSPRRTADGQPDLEGYWTNATLTPLERPAQFAGKAVLTEAEAAAYARQLREANNRDRRGDSAEADVGGAYNQFWYDRGNGIVGSRRTSLIIEPADGLIPPLTPAAQKRVEEARAYAAAHPADGPESRSLAERCILWGTAGPPMMPGPYNNAYQIVQTRDSVTILVEMIHDARMIPLDGRPHLPGTVRQWMGDPRGHFEGNTLVVDSTGFNGKAPFHGSDANLHLTEKFTRVSADTLLYEFTVDDPTAFTKKWTAQIPFTRTDGPIYEYACNEGNYAMTDMLAGARKAESGK
ncbi:MAG TPA: hypothetical protein VKV17_22240 [Bryobacteraceae bacterium]|nr:hypothetical protein [Bryobacteraceae bacterium]